VAWREELSDSEESDSEESDSETGSYLGQDGLVELQLVDTLNVGQLETLNELHGQNSRGGEVGVDGRDADVVDLRSEERSD
jgi:hypothetical protein